MGALGAGAFPLPYLGRLPLRTTTQAGAHGVVTVRPACVTCWTGQVQARACSPDQGGRPGQASSSAGTWIVEIESAGSVALMSLPPAPKTIGSSLVMSFWAAMTIEPSGLAKESTFS